MTGTIDRQLELRARNGLSRRLSAIARDNSSPLIPRAIYDKSAPDRMLVHETQAAFLNALLAYEDGEASRQLQSSLAKADRESKCVRRTLFVMLMLLLLSVAGLSHCAILLPRVFSDPTHLVIMSLSILGLASFVCLLELTGYLLWHRFAVDRLHKECRRRVLLLVESRLKPSLRRSLNVEICQKPGSTTASAPVQ